jgi:hypothetical protein
MLDVAAEGLGANQSKLTAGHHMSNMIPGSQTKYLLPSVACCPAYSDNGGDMKLEHLVTYQFQR